MNRFGWGLLLWLLAVPLVVLLVMPFTQGGSRVLLDSADRLLPLDIEYGGGTLAGQLNIQRLVWSGDGVRVELDDVLAELMPACWWRSAICFRQLQAARLDVSLLANNAEAVVTAPEPSSPADDSLVQFPVRLETAVLAIQSTRVRWEGGEWRQGRIEGSVIVSGSSVQVVHAVVQGAALELSESSADSAAGLPEIDLPLELLVDELVLEQPGWDIYGSRQALNQLTLSGGWRHRKLQLDKLQASSADLGELLASGSIRFAGDWPLSLDAEVTLADVAGWPAILARDITVAARGDLARLQISAGIAGEVSLAAEAELKPQALDLPFQLSAQLDWPDVLSLGDLLEAPDETAGIDFTGPLRLSGSGTLTEQLFQLQVSGWQADYQALDLHLAGRHQSGLLTIEDMRLQDSAGANSLWASGELAYGEQLRGSLAIETDGLDLPAAISTYTTGRFEGNLQLAGSSSDSGWQLSLSEVDLKGNVNGLPAEVTGFTGMNDGLRLLQSDLRAEVNGARLVLQTGTEQDGPGRLELTIEELARWQPGARGRISLHADLAADWQHIALSGSLRELAWQGLELKQGEVTGEYRPGAGRVFNLDLLLSELTWSDSELASVHLKASGDETAQSLSLQSHGELEGALKMSGAFADNGSWAGQLAATSLQTDYGTWHLADAVPLSWDPAASQFVVAGHCWQYQQTRICPGEAELGQSGSASLVVEGGMEFLAEFLPVDFEIHGALKSQFAASWTPARGLSLDGTLETGKVSLTRHYGEEESGTVSWDSADVLVRSNGQGLSVSGEMQREGRRIIALNARLPAARSEPIAGTVDFFDLHLATLGPFIPALSTVEGVLAAKLQLKGTVEEPQVWGSMQLDGGRVALVGNPTELQDLAILLDVQGDRANISGRGRLGGGMVNLDGKLLLRPTLRVEIDVSGDKHELLLPPYIQMLVSEKLAVVATEGLVDMRGSITVHEGTLRHEQLPQGSVGLSGDVVEVDYAGNIVREARPFDTSMDLMLVIEDNFKIVGDMVNATVGGDLQLLQTAGQPLQLFGNLNVIGGELRAYQQRLRIARGTIAFSGTPENPELDVRAQREISSEKILVGLQLRGTLTQPQLEVFSDPVMSQAETMSYLVRGRGLDSGASADGLAMALSLGSGLVNQSPLVAELNSIPGVSNLAFGAEGSAEDTAATIGGYLGERLYLSYGMGIYEPISVLTARLYLQTRLWLEVVSRLENSVDLYYSFDID